MFLVAVGRLVEVSLADKFSAIARTYRVLPTEGEEKIGGNPATNLWL